MADQEGPTRCPESLQPNEKRRIIRWLKQEHPELLPGVARRWDDCRDFHLERGTLSFNWEATFKRWLRIAAKVKPHLHERRVERLSEGQVQHIFQVIQGGKK